MKENQLDATIVLATPAACTRFAPKPPAQRPQHTAHYTYATGLFFLPLLMMGEHTRNM
jgi:hypothetical protein